MKRSYIAGFGAIALMTAMPFVGEMPVLANLRQAGEAIAQNIQRQPQVALSLGAEKKIIRNQQGKQQVSWRTLQGNVTFNQEICCATLSLAKITAIAR